MFQFNIVFGILVAFLSNALLAGIGENAWRWMLGVAAFPALLYTALCFVIPESPRWLIGTEAATGRPACAVLGMIHPEVVGGRPRSARRTRSRSASLGSDTSGRFWTMRLRTPILLAFLIAFFNQLSGINAILYFAPRIFEMTGLGAKAALLQSVGIGLTNLVFTFVGLWLIDRSDGARCCSSARSATSRRSASPPGRSSPAHYAIVPACIFAFIAAHAVGQGAVIWVFISEIFPNRHRAEGQALGSFTHWIFAALLTTFFPKMVVAFAPG